MRPTYPARSSQVGWKTDWIHKNPVKIPNVRRETRTGREPAPRSDVSQDWKVRLVSAATITGEYSEGAGIGWHRDKPHFEDVAGVSLLAPCSLRLRRKNETKWDRTTIIVEPRSAYLMTGPARNDWEHSIPPLSAHRYSITLRTLRLTSG